MLRKIIFSASALLFYALTAPAQTTRQWRDSLAVLTKMIERSVYSSDLHLKKAAVNLQLGQWNYAIDEYNMILQKEPENLAALFYRAYAHTNLRRYDLAKNDYTDFLRIAPYNMEARLGLAHVYRKQNRPHEAMDELNRLVEIFPDSSVVFAARADFEKERKALDAALYDWNEAIRLQPDNTDFAISKVDVLLLMGKKKEARMFLDDIVRKGVPKGVLQEWYRKCAR